MRRYLLPLFFAALASAQPGFRPPAVPLITSDPYFSVWSMADRLNAEGTKHWTGTPQEIYSLIRADGTAYRLMGAGPKDLSPLPQKSVQVLPTRTIYTFGNAAVNVTLTFLTPILPRDLDLVSRPVTYLTWEVTSADGSPHKIQIYFEASAELAQNTPDQLTESARMKLRGLRVLRLGTRQQPILEKSGDNLRIDWGHLYVSAPDAPGTSEAAVERQVAREAFLSTGAAPENDDLAYPQIRRRKVPVLAYALDLGTVAAAPVSRHLMVAYDDVFSLEFLNRRVRPYWRRNGADASSLLQAAAREYASLEARARQFDEELLSDLRRTGGEEYARLCSLAYRQAMAAHKLAVDADGTPLFFSKENFSNGCINTVDVFYPSAPMFLLLNTTLLRGSVEPLLAYASMPRWRFPFAPHDLGTYPLANGQVYGGGELTEDRQMPVEESGNMLLLVAAMAHIDGRLDLARKYWPLLTRWAEYLRDKGLDPENQLCTDDFAGHLARNANLSIKAIEALGAYARLCEMTGRKADGARYMTLARDYAKKWITLAADGDHTVLAFGAPGTWSQKYNLVWDRILGLNLFPPEVARKEIAYYKTKQNTYGLPLDNRADYTKLDWLVWTATLAENDADFHALLDPAYKWISKTPTRVPLTDWYMTSDGRQRGFQARSVVGGVFIKMLADPVLWKKWATRK